MRAGGGRVNKAKVETGLATDGTVDASSRTKTATAGADTGVEATGTATWVAAQSAQSAWATFDSGWK